MRTEQVRPREETDTMDDAGFGKDIEDSSEENYDDEDDYDVEDEDEEDEEDQAIKRAWGMAE